MQSLQGLFEQPAETVPPLPGIVASLMKMPPDTPRRAVLAALRQAPELSHAALTMAGSPYYSGRRPIRSPSHLVERVGLSGVRGLVLRGALETAVFRRPGQAMARIKAHSTATAYISRVISRHVSVHSETAYACAMLQHMGVAVPLSHLIQQTGMVPDPEVAWEALACAHEAIAGVVAGTWGMPEPLQAILARHHQLSRDDTDAVIATLILADLIACEQGEGLSVAEHPPPSAEQVDAALERLDLPASWLPRIQRDAVEVLERVIT